MNSTTTKTPLSRLALHSTAACSVQATAYGKCILAIYTDVTKDVCKEDFAKFAKCLREAKALILNGGSTAFRTVKEVRVLFFDMSHK
ncbi:hypothetical protein DFH07DRAFT_1061244 [Mycena maculata]|uniref:Uncharacterized protein n=1 Tax=Mycena maculata TaxID=230809 RepID=A0AAD7J1N3_9AGAR|nr:hypothetical protein DFH07DRAFT_1061244 [Mycena maculata]